MPEQDNLRLRARARARAKQRQGSGSIPGDFASGFATRAGEVIQGLGQIPSAVKQNLQGVIEAAPEAVSAFTEDPLGSTKESLSATGQFFKDMPGAIAEDSLGDDNLSTSNKAGRVTADIASLLIPVKGGQMIKGLRAGKAAKAVAPATRSTSTAFNLSDDLVRPGSFSISQSTGPSAAASTASQSADDVLRLQKQFGAGPKASRAFRPSPELRSGKGFTSSHTPKPFEAPASPVASTPVRDLFPAKQSSFRPDSRFRTGRGTNTSAARKTVSPEAQALVTKNQKAIAKAAQDKAPKGPIKAQLAGTPENLAEQAIRDSVTMEGVRSTAQRFNMSEAAVEAINGGRPKHLPLKAQTGFLDASYRAATKGLEKAVKNDAGFAHTRMAAAIGGGGVGAAIGHEFADEGTQAGAAIALGLLGAGGAVKLTQWAASNPAIASDVFSKIHQGWMFARVEGALSGTAIPKNVMNMGGAQLTAAAERGSIAPLKEALRLPTNVRAFGRGFSGTSQTVDNLVGVTEGSRRAAGPFSRIIAGVDNAAMESMERAGLTKPQINRLLVRRPLTDILTKEQAQRLSTPVAREALLFQRTPFNVAMGGLDEIADLGGKASTKFSGPLREATVAGTTLGRRNAVTGGVMALGAGTAVATEGMDSYQKLLVFGLLAAAQGPRAMAFGVGAGVGGAGREGLIGLSPVPEFGLDPQAVIGGLAEPAGLRTIRKLRE